MPLSPSTARSPVHTRTVTCNAFHRDDDLIDIEGHMTDVKSYEIPNRWRGPILPGQPIHDMWLRLTLDRDFTCFSTLSNAKAVEIPDESST